MDAGSTALRFANARGVPGTATTVVRDRDGAALLLTSHHVVFGDGAREGSRVWALADEGGGTAVLGRALRGVLGRVGSTEDACFVDCALIALDQQPRPPWLAAALEGLARPHGIAEAVPGLLVSKHGAATGVTDGVVRAVAHADRPFIAGRMWAAPGQLIIESRDDELNFSAPGDSGAAVVDGEGRLVGLLWGCNGHGAGLACPIAPVLACLEVALP